MDAESPHPLRGAFTWDAGGWFGALFGCTIWILLMGLLVIGRAWQAGAAMIACWGMAFGVGCLLWRRRKTLAMTAAIQWMLLVSGLAGAGALGALQFWATPEAAEAVDQRSDVSLSGAWWWLLVYPALMLGFAIAARRARQRGEA